MLKAIARQGRGCREGRDVVGVVVSGARLIATGYKGKNQFQC